MRRPDPFGLPIALLARFDTLVIFDHARQRVLAVANEVEGEVSMAEAERELSRLSRVLTQGTLGGGIAMPSFTRKPPADVTASLDGASFRQAVLTAKEHIAAGDIFQVVLARRFSIPRRIEPLALYRAVRMVNPSPYMVLLETPDAALVGASPEMLSGRPAGGSRRGRSRRYAPPRLIGQEKITISGTPEEDRICTSHVERANWTLRGHLRRFTRLSNGFSRKRDNLRAALALYFAYYNFCRMHKSIRMTPAMSAGIARKPWSMTDLVKAAMAASRAAEAVAA